MASDHDEPRPHGAAVQRIALDAAQAVRQMKFDAVASEIAQLCIDRVRQGEIDPQETWRALLTAAGWIMASGTNSQEEFERALMSMQGAVSSFARIRKRDDLLARLWVR